MYKFKASYKLQNKVEEYFKNNIKEYLLVVLIFIVGILIGVLLINNYSYDKTNLISSYIVSSFEKFKSTNDINYTKLILKSVKNNFILTFIIWITGTTAIGLPIVLVLILFRGGCLGYTIASILYTFGRGKGLVFCLAILFWKNLLFVPSILTLGVSSINLHKSIINDRRENIKIVILRHTIISVIMFIFLMISSFVENGISIKLLELLSNFFL